MSLHGCDANSLGAGLLSTNGENTILGTLVSGDPVPNEPKTDDAEVLSQIISSMKKLDADARKRVYQTIGTFFQLEEGPSRPSGYAEVRPASELRPSGASAGPSFSDDRAPKPKQFLSEKQPRTDVERVACLAYYLTHYRDMPEFTTLDISKLNTEAAQRKLSNATAAVNNASQYGYLVPAAKGTKQISAAGERYVQELPNYEAAKEAMTGARPRWRAKANNNKKKLA
jgi:hypothetical protein